MYQGSLSQNQLEAINVLSDFIARLAAEPPQGLEHSYWIPQFISQKQSNSTSKIFKVSDSRTIFQRVQLFVQTDYKLRGLSNDIDGYYSTEYSRPFIPLLVVMTVHLVIATQQQLIQPSDIKVKIVERITRLFQGEEIREVYFVIDASRQLNSSIVLENGVAELVPASPQLIGYLNSAQTFSLFEHSKALYEFILNQPVLKATVIYSPPPSYSTNCKEELLWDIVRFAINLAWQEPAISLISYRCEVTIGLLGHFDGNARSVKPLKGEATLKDQTSLLFWWSTIRKFCRDLTALSTSKAGLYTAINHYRKALTSSGSADACLDLMIALEALLGTGKDELKFRYSLMAATALRDSPDSRRRVFQHLSTAYDARSLIAHGSAKGLKPKHLEPLRYVEQYIAELIGVFLRWSEHGTEAQLREELLSCVIEGRVPKPASVFSTSEVDPLAEGSD